MRRTRKFGRYRIAWFAIACFALLPLATSAAAEIGPTRLTFKEPEKGTTSAFVDNPPKIGSGHGPPKISAGDEVIFTNPLTSKGKVVGKVRVVCTATTSAGSKDVYAAGFNCLGSYKIPGGTLFVAAELVRGPTEGAVIGGTGEYAGARGTFVSKSAGGGSSLTTISLLE